MSTNGTTLNVGSWISASGKTIPTTDGNYYLIACRAYYSGNYGKCSVSGGEVLLDFNGPLSNMGSAGSLGPIALVKGNGTNLTITNGSNVTIQSVHYVEISN